MPATNLPSKRSAPSAFAGGAVIGALGGLIGLGGAEFRLPLLIGAFRFPALQAVILNKAMSLIVVASALPFRTAAVPFASVAAHWSDIVNLLAGSLLGAWFGAGWATKLASQTLYRVISIMLLLIAVILVLSHDKATSGALLIGTEQMVAGVVAGFVIGIVAALLGVAGGELLIPTFVLLFGADIKLAGVCRSQSACRRCSSASRATVGIEASWFSAKIAASCWSWRLAQSLGASSAANCSGSFRRLYCCPCWR